jgi:hypothetical protein
VLVSPEDAHIENEDKQKEEEEYIRVFCKVRKTQH